MEDIREAYGSATPMTNTPCRSRTKLICRVTLLGLSAPFILPITTLGCWLASNTATLREALAEALAFWRDMLRGTDS